MKATWLSFQPRQNHYSQYSQTIGGVACGLGLWTQGASMISCLGTISPCRLAFMAMCMFRWYYGGAVPQYCPMYEFVKVGFNTMFHKSSQGQKYLVC